MKKSFTLTLLILSITATFGQHNLPFEFTTPTKLDTLYYKPGNGVQMIIVDHVGLWKSQINFLEATNPRATPHTRDIPEPSGNEFFFRHIKDNKIFKAYNTLRSLEELSRHFSKIEIGQNFVTACRDNTSFNGLYKVFSGGYGLIDNQGSFVIPPIYQDISPLGKNILAYNDKAKYGIIDHKGRIILPVKYDKWETSNDGNIFIFSKDNKFSALYSLNTNKVLSIRKYGLGQIIAENSLGWFLAAKNGVIGLMDLNGKTILPFKYNSIQFLDRENILVSENHKFGIIDLKQLVKVPIIYDMVHNDGSETPFTFGQKFKVLFFEINKKCNTIYDIARSQLIKTDDYDYIQCSNPWCNNPQQFSDYYSHGYLMVQNFWSDDKGHHAKFGLIDIDGRLVLPVIYDKINEIYPTNYVDAEIDGEPFRLKLEK